jgi:ABC-type tungstate transport system permease subunit
MRRLRHRTAAGITGSRRIAVAMAASLMCAALLLAPHAGAVTVTDDQGCWATLNELAAAAVFADLPDEKLETVYALLDQLQDHCENKNFTEATKVTKEIETLVGK